MPWLERCIARGRVTRCKLSNEQFSGFLFASMSSYQSHCAPLTGPIGVRLGFEGLKAFLYRILSFDPRFSQGKLFAEGAGRCCFFFFTALSPLCVWFLLLGLGGQVPLCLVAGLRSVAGVGCHSSLPGVAGCLSFFLSLGFFFIYPVQPAKSEICAGV